MASVDPPSLPPAACDRDSAIQEMVRGREMAGRLGALLRGSRGEAAGAWDGHLQARELAEELLRCCSAALASLGRGESAEFRPVPTGTLPGKRRIKSAGEQRRGRTRRSQPHAWKTVTSKTMDDGHTWRKYGQKEIHGSTHPRCYFRCTYKQDQGCQATRQVQKAKNDPSLFQITYLGHHTCKRPTTSLRHVAVGPDGGEQFLIGFGSPGRYHHPVGSPPAAAFPPPRQEPEEDALSCSPSRNDWAPEYLTLPELTALQEVSAPATGISSAASDVAGDVTSGGLRSPCASPGSRLFFPDESYRFEDVFVLDPDELNYEFNNEFPRVEPVYGP